MVATTSIIDAAIATSSIINTAVATSSSFWAGDVFGVVKNIVVPLIVPVVSVLAERWFGISKLIIKETHIEQKFVNTMKVTVIGWKNKVILDEKGVSLSVGGPARDPLGQPDVQRTLPESILTPSQKAICDAVLRTSKKYTSQTLDLENDYEIAVKTRNDGEKNLAAGRFFMIFNRIKICFSSITAIRGSASKQIEDQENVVSSLERMLSDPATSDEQLGRQVETCEFTTMRLVEHLP